MPARKNPTPDLSVLPSIDELLRTVAGREVIQAAGSEHATRVARACVTAMRGRIAEGASLTRSSALSAAEKDMSINWSTEALGGTRQVINATGVVIHTNLGRAPLSDAAQAAIANAAGYAATEFDLVTGKRGLRGGRAEELIAELTGAEGALIVNNCAAAAFFVLTAFASGGEVVVSRGELVEIGGDFRVPDVLEQSGATLREVGTTNRTKLSDYDRAVRANTKMLLRVHPSNYRIIGFTETPSSADLAALAKKKRILFYEDLGSGALIDLTGIGLDEPVAKKVLKDGAHVITFSGDKLLGGPQAGIIAGRRKYIDQLRKHPLYRALRASKLTYAALEATLLPYRCGMAIEDVPVLRMLSLTEKQIGGRAKKLLKNIDGVTGLSAQLIEGISAVGGGAAPGVQRPTVLISLRHSKYSASELARQLRAHSTPVIARIEAGKVLIDLRTVDPGEASELAAAIRSLAQ